MGILEGPDPQTMNGKIHEPPPGFFDDSDEASGVRLKPKKDEKAETRSIILWGDDLAKPVEEKRWISEALTIQAGARPTVFCGRGGALKGWFVMAMQVCGAAGVPLLGFPLKEGLKSIYLDWEQTPDTTKERFQLLARGYGYKLAEFREHLAYAWQPVLSLAPKSERELENVISKLSFLTEGFDLAIVDSCFSASGLSLEENTGAASIPFRVMTSVSVRTGVTFGCLDHMGKKSKDPLQEQSDGDEQRGHSSKGQQVQTRFIMHKGGKGRPTRVRCNRSQGVEESLWPENFQFAIESAMGGCRLALFKEPEAATPTESAAFDRIKEATLNVVKGNPGLNTKAILARVTGKTTTIQQAIRELLKERRMIDLGTDDESEYRAL
jgi:AAA domain